MVAGLYGRYEPSKATYKDVGAKELVA